MEKESRNDVIQTLLDNKFKDVTGGLTIPICSKDDCSCDGDDVCSHDICNIVIYGCVGCNGNGQG